MIALVLSGMGMLGPTGAAATPPPNGLDPAWIVLRVHNYAGVPTEVLAPGLLETLRILHLAGVEARLIVRDSGPLPGDSFSVYWAASEGYRRRESLKTELVDCSISAPAVEENPACQRVDPAVLVVNVIHRRMMSQLRLQQGNLGFTPMENELGPFTHAYVFYDLVEQFSQKETVACPSLMGRVIAHEIGHMLLGKGKHFVDGLMHCYWDASDLGFGSRPKMVFTDGQSRAIRAEINLRLTERQRSNAPLLAVDQSKPK